MMYRSKSCIVAAIALSMIIGMFVIAGCGSSAEQQKLTTMIQEYNQVVEDYAAAVQAMDDSKMVELEGKVKTYMTAWVDTKSEMMDAITPQVLDELDHEYQEITKKYQSLVKT
jgi:outer membrane murein-binding lipoprotein Lpp